MTKHQILIRTSWLNYSHNVNSKEDLKLLSAVLKGVESHASNGILQKGKKRPVRFKKPYHPSLCSL